MKLDFYRGFLINPEADGKVNYYKDGLLAVDEKGKTAYAGDGVNFEGNIPDLDKNYIILPGMTDLHTHLPQYPAMGIGKGELLEWLNNYIFPLEKKCADEAWARQLSKQFFDDMLKNGTTTACIFSSPYKNATDIAFEEAEKSGIRAFIGKCLMDMGAPKGLLSDTDANIKESAELAKKWHGRDNRRLNYIVLPRYAGACSFELLKKSAEFAKSEGLMLQTHLAENQNELKYIQKLFPYSESYSDVYNKAGLLSENTMLVHAIYLSEKEIQALQNNKCKIIHCPVSNRFLASGILTVNRLRHKGLKIGLGTDVAAGYSFSVFHEAMEAIECSKILSLCGGTQSDIIDIEQAYCMATIYSAEILGIANNCGNLQKGKDADFILIDPDKLYLYNLDEKELLAKILYSNIETEKTYVRGKLCYERTTAL